MMMTSDARVRRWLQLSAGAVVLAVAIGGITRLTESGLSITEWRPVSGVLPPMSAAEWERVYNSYLTIPEAQTTHLGITLHQFKTLFWWEWLHRILARLVGLVLAVPYVVLLVGGHIRKSMRARLALLPILALAQGVLGWYMVQSGLEVRTDVSPYRLTAHLGMALIIFVVCVWTTMELNPRRDEHVAAQPALRRGIVIGLWLAIVTVLSGGFVAGLDAGKIFNSFPLMGGQIVPPGYYTDGLGWRNAFENPIAAQFHHRALALSTAAFILVLAARARRAGVAPAVRDAMTAAGLIVVVQVMLGITTLLLHVPTTIAVIHQVTGLALLTAMLVAVHASASTSSLPMSAPSKMSS